MDLAHFWNTSGAYQINQSLRFNSADSAYLNRTPATTTSRTTWTWSAWIKRGILTTDDRMVFSAATSLHSSNPTITYLGFNTSNQFVHYSINNGSLTWNRTTSQVFRDVSGWYHIVCVLDTSNATAGNRVRVYVNGTEVTAWATDTTPSQNAEGFVNLNTATHKVGQEAIRNRYSFDGYLAEVNFIDGTALTPSSFGETDTITGAWIPKKYSGSYGTNGFYLKYESSGIGTDSSGNGNNWTANNFSTSGTGTDVMSDTPTNNYATMNPIDAVSTSSASDGNLVTSNTNNVSSPGIRSTFSMPSGKWYWEVTCGTFTSAATWMLGIQESNATVSNWQAATTYAYYSSNGQKYNNGSGTAYGNTYTTNDVIGIAYDADNGKLYFAKNNTWQNSGDPVAGTGAAWSGLTGSYSAWVGTGLYTVQSIFNFGQRAFAYTPPTGFKALSTGNLPEPTIKKGGAHFNTVLWTGNDTYPRAITGVGFQPDLLWTKTRNTADDNILMDVIRGTGNLKWLSSNLTSAEGVDYNNANVTSLDSDGFTIGTTGGTNQLNSSTRTVVAWNWKANGAGSTNTAGSITSTVSANATAGFSIVSYTGTGANATVGHGLGVAPSMMIVKRRTATTGEWWVYHSALGATKGLNLNSTATPSTLSVIWNNTEPTSSVFSVGTGSDLNASGGTYVAYLWSEVAGYSKFGSYTGNGSSDGPFVFCGFRPRWVMIKRTNSTGNWYLYDTARETYNVMFNDLCANLSNAENVTINTDIDVVSNGFKLRGPDGDVNFSGHNYIFAAFAEHPFKYANAR